MKFKKILLITAVFAFQFTSLIFSQSDSSSASLPIDSSGINVAVQRGDTLSSTPTISEINGLFLRATKGEADPFRIVSLVSSKKDNAIPALEGFLFQPVDTTKDTTGFTRDQPNKQYAIYALDAIGTQKAEKLLIKVVQSHPDNEVRGLALKTLAFNFYYRTKNDQMSNRNDLQPDKELVHILMQNADDTTYVESCNECIGKIAREGINNWTGEDYGDVPKTQETVKLAGNKEMNIKDYREQWWQRNSGKIEWNRATDHFEQK